jgi:catechol 2,3-dioxygenase-like lactoylglutathione lyase family enzyme
MAQRISHVGLTVSDIGRSTKFYEQLGFVKKFDIPVDDDTPLIKTITGFPNAHVKIQHLVLDDAVLELLQYLAPVGPNQAAMPTCNPGSAHLAVSVDDVFEEIDRLSALGVKFRSEPITIREGAFAGARAVYGIDPDGYTVEIVDKRGG